MKITGGCYCRELRYEAEGDPMFKALCHCRECQYISGGSANAVMGMPAANFRYVSGAPKAFARTDLEKPASREFCPNCGTHILTRIPDNPAVVILKVGTLDDQATFDGPQVAIWTSEKRPWHVIAEGVMTFETRPGA